MSHDTYDDTLYNTLHSIYMSGDLDMVEKGIDSGINPNLRVKDIKDIEDIENNPYFAGDDLGLFWHLIDGGTLLSLAMIAKHKKRFEMMSLLIRKGAKVNHPKNIAQTISLIDVEIYKFMVEHGLDLLSTRHSDAIFPALRNGSIELLEYLYDVIGLRLTSKDKEDYDEACYIVKERCFFSYYKPTPEIEEKLFEYVEKFTRRGHIF